MHVPVGKNLRIITDENNYILEKKMISKNTKEIYWEGIRWYPCLDYLIQELFDTTLFRSEIDSFPRLKKEMAEVADQYRKIMDNFDRLKKIN